MAVLENKIDFAVVFTVTNANPNGDPLNGNRPRETYGGQGEISDVCIKRKIRNRLQDMGEKIFVQMDERCDDGCGSLSERASSNADLKAAGKNKAEYAAAACREWMDVRSFGQVFAFKAGKGEGDSGVSVGIRGPVSIQPALSHGTVDIESIQITKSVNGEPGDKKSSDTMGSKHRIPFGLYSFCGSINCQLAEKTEFSQEDAEKIHEALRTLFENDASAARPEGSMEVCRVYWWQHDCKTGQYSSAKVHRCLRVVPKTEQPQGFEDFEVYVEPLEGLAVQEDDLF